MDYGIGDMTAGFEAGLQQHQQRKRRHKREDERDAMQREQHEARMRNFDQDYGIRQDKHNAWQTEYDQFQSESQLQQQFDRAVQQGEVAGDWSAVADFASENLLGGTPVEIQDAGDRMVARIGDQQMEFGRGGFMSWVQSMRQPGEMTRFQQQIQQQIAEMQQGNAEHRQNMAERIASADPDRVRFSQDGGYGITDPAPGGGDLDDFLSLARVNPRHMDMSVAADAIEHYERTGNRAEAYRILSRGVRGADHEESLERMASISDIAREMMPPRTEYGDVGEPVEDFIEGYGRSAEKYGVTSDDTYGEAMSKIERGLAEELGVTPAPQEPASGRSGASGPGITDDQVDGVLGRASEQIQRRRIRQELQDATEAVRQGRDPQRVMELMVSEGGVPPGVARKWAERVAGVSAPADGYGVEPSNWERWRQ